jgi:hypothetical protein
MFVFVDSTANSLDRGICGEFKNMTVILAHYSVHSCCRSRPTTWLTSWVVDGSSRESSWAYKICPMVRHDVLRSNRMNLLTTSREIIPFDPDDLLRQFRSSQARYDPRHLAVLLEDSMIGKVYHS